ncbi:MAG: NAD(P)/FAD-dependent oxidoreductase [Candidatus Aminicenantes bacterium]|nr:NAD(P)/FAD-dependent oxidoreductase [Candidatus Aminicenantes bacterium]
MGSAERLTYDVAVIGGGVVGCAVLRELSRYELRLVLLEREADLAEGVTKANSGVIHAGFNVPPRSLKARTNVAGLKLVYELASTLGVPHRKTGKLVVALADEDRPRLEELKAQGDRSGVAGLEIVDEAAIRRLEPLARGRWALWSPDTGIISPYEFTYALAECAAANGAEVRLESPVKAVGVRGGLFLLKTPRGEVAARRVVNSAGLFADEVARLAGIDGHRIVPYRGEYLITDKAPGLGLGRPVYPVAPRDDPGLGIHVTPTLEGNISLGPSAEAVDDKRDVATTREVAARLKEEAARLMPALAGAPLIHGYAGIRPKLVDPGGAGGFGDFVVEESERRPGWIDLMGIESPGLTSAPALAEMVVAMIGARMGLELRADFRPARPVRRRFADLDDEARAGRVARDAGWGEMVCRCEHVTRAEVVAALRNPFGARTLDAVKRRTRCGMGRCQGGFCTPRIVEILDEEGVPADRVTKRAGGSCLFQGRVKGRP